MKKLIFLIVTILLLNSCSFDNKTGIWDGEIKSKKKLADKNRNLENIFPQSDMFNREKRPQTNIKAFLDEVKINKNWTEKYLNQNNKLANFAFNNEFNTRLLSKKINPSITSEILLENQNIILHSKRGTIFVYSIEKKNELFRFNFYDKKTKKHDLKLRKFVSNNFIYVADNLGYLYCLDISKKKLAWAKNYNIPFFSNLKLKNQILFLVNENNNLIAVNSKNGERARNFFTDKSLFQTNYVNSLALKDENLYLLNSNGNLYSLKTQNFQLNWIRNFKPASANKTSNLFYAHPLTVVKDKIVVSTKNSISVIDSKSSSMLWSANIDSRFKPIISGNLIFLLTMKNYLICLNSENGEIYWSRNYKDTLSKENVKFKNIGEIIDIKIIQNKIFLTTQKSKIIQLDPISSEIISIKNMNFKIFNKPIIANNKIYYLDSKKRLIEIN